MKLAFVLTLWGSLLRGQVPAVTQLDQHGDAQTMIANAGHEPQRITVELRRGDVVGGRIVLGDPVRAIVAPVSFTLGAGDAQVLRMRLKERVAPHTTLRLVVTFAPLAANEPPARDGIVTRLALVTRFITKVVTP